MTLSIAWVRDAVAGESAHREVDTERRRYRAFRCFPEGDWVQNVILGGARPDFAVHVGDVATLPQERLFVLDQVGIPLIVAPSEPALFRDLDARDDPIRDTRSPLLLPVETVLSVRGRGTVVTGRIERGRLRLMDELELVGAEEPVPTIVTQIERERARADEAEAGDHVFSLLRGIELDQVARGHTLAARGTVRRSSTLCGSIALAPHTRVGAGARFHFGIHNVRSTCRVSVLESDQVTLELFEPVPLPAGVPFVLFDGPRVAAVGASGLG